MAEQLANDIQTLLVADLTAGATKLKALTSAGFPGLPQYRIRIDDELILVTALAGNEWTIERGIEGTAAAAHKAGAAIYHLLTKGSLLATIQEGLAGAQPVDADLTAIAALTTSPFGRGLLALASAAAGRSTLELGTAAQQPSTAFDAAGAAAAAQSASQPLDADLTAIAALTTTPFGRSVLEAASAAGLRALAGASSAAELAAEIVAREAAELVLRETLAREQSAEKYWPALAGFKLFKTQGLVPAANSGHLLRWIPPRGMTLRGLAFVTTVAATVNDECAVALKAEDGKTTLAKSLGTAGLLNSAVARKDLDFTADVAVTGGKTYYLAFQYGTVGGTAATLLSAEVVNGNSVGGIFGTAPGSAWVGQATPTFPFATETAFSTASNRVFLFARER